MSAAQEGVIAIPLKGAHAVRVMQALAAAGLCPAYEERQILKGAGRSAMGLAKAAVMDAYDADPKFQSAIASVPGAQRRLRALASGRGRIDVGPPGPDGTYWMRQSQGAGSP